MIINLYQSKLIINYQLNYLEIKKGLIKKLKNLLKRSSPENDYMNLDAILIPINDSNHWWLLVIDFNFKTVYILDSFTK